MSCMLVEMRDAANHPVKVVVFVASVGILLCMSQMMASLSIQSSKQTVHNQWDAWNVTSGATGLNKIQASKAQMAFCKEHKLEGTIRAGKLNLIQLDDMRGFCGMHSSTWGFLKPQLDLMAIAPVPSASAFTPDTLELTPENVSASQLASAPVLLPNTWEITTYTQADLEGQYGLHTVKPRWKVPQLKEFINFITSTFQFNRTSQAVSKVTAANFTTNIYSYLGFCVSFRNVTNVPTLLASTLFLNIPLYTYVSMYI
jgi:hypothetical protein